MFEAKIKSLESEEQRLRAENVRLGERNVTLEAEQVQNQKQLADLFETNIRLNTDICALEELQNSAAFSRSDRDNEEIMELMEKITRLQMENTDLRDRNDELCAELDGLAGELSVIKGRRMEKMNKNTGTVEGDLVAGAESSNLSTSPGSLMGASQATKRRGDSPSKSKLAGESPRLGKLRKCSSEEGGDDDEEEEEDHEGMELPLNAELNKEEVKSSLVSALKTRVTELENALRVMKERSVDSEVKEGNEEDEKNTKEDAAVKCLNCEDMESSLDLMRKEFDSLEDYWQGKVNEERVLFEDEQRVNEDKFNDLLQKMLEYEEQFSSQMKKEDAPEERDPRLSPIEERDFLEQQYLDLEEELNGLKRILREKNEEIKGLRTERKSPIELRLPSLVAAADPFNISIDQTSPPQSPAASSPINYLWSQSTIQAPARDYQNPNWQKPQQHQQQKVVMEQKESSVFANELDMALDVEEAPIVVSPIQKPKPGSLRSGGSDNGLDNCDKVSVASSIDRHSTATYNVPPKVYDEIKTQLSSPLETAGSVGVVVAQEEPKDLIDAVDAEELNQQQILLRQLHADCKELVHRRDALLNELQQLNEMRPQLEKNFAVSLVKRICLMNFKFNFVYFLLITENDSPEPNLKDTAVGAEESSAAECPKATASVFRVINAP